MARRLDAMTARESNGKTYWSRLGVAFESKDGTGWNVLLDSMPAPQDGQFKIILREPREDSGQQRQQQPERQAGGGRAVDPDDIPFSASK